MLQNSYRLISRRRTVLHIKCLRLHTVFLLSVHNSSAVLSQSLISYPKGQNVTDPIIYCKCQSRSLSEVGVPARPHLYGA